MTNYKQHEYNIRISITDILNYKVKKNYLGSIQELEEFLFDSNIDNYYQNSDSVKQYYLDDAIEHLKILPEFQGKNAKLLNFYQEEIISQCIQSIADATRDNFQTSVTKAVRELIESEYITIPVNRFKYVNNKEWYEAIAIDYYFNIPGNIKEFKELFKDNFSSYKQKGITLIELIQNMIDDGIFNELLVIEQPKIRNYQDSLLAAIFENIEGCYGYSNSDNWLKYFQENQDISYNIKQQIKKRSEKIKDMIKNHVPLEYRLQA